MLVTTLIGLGRIAVSLAFVWASKRLVDIATGQSSMPLQTGIGLFIGILILQLALVTLFNGRRTACGSTSSVMCSGAAGTAGSVSCPGIP